MNATRTAAALASAVVFGALTFGAGTALADPPAPGTEACDLLVSADARITDSELTGDALDGLRATVTAQLCTGTVETTTPAPTTTTEPTTAAPSGPTVSSVLALVAKLNCDSYATKRGRITDQSADLVGKASSADLGRIADALTKRDRALNYCLSTSPLNPTQDDGSVVPDGSQVVEVPQGSASTGA